MLRFSQISILKISNSSKQKLLEKVHSSTEVHKVIGRTSFFYISLGFWFVIYSIINFDLTDFWWNANVALFQFYLKWFGQLLATSEESIWGIFLTKFGIYMFKVSNRITRTRCEICSKLTIKTPERRRVVLVSLLLTLNIFQTLF